MRLKAFRVQNFKTIRDSGRVEVKKSVTCLLGQNESGKSAVLQALWKSRNVSEVEFDMLYDYPKEGYTRARGTNPIVTSLEYEFEDADVEAYAEEVGGTKPSDICIETAYDGTRTASFEVGFEQMDTTSLLKTLKELNKRVQVPEEGQPDPLAPVRQYAEQLSEALTADDAEAVRLSSTALVRQVRTHHDALGGTETAEQLEALAGYRSKEEHRAAVNDWLLDRQPAFIYFDEYGVLGTRIHLPEHLRQVARTPHDRLARTRMALFEWARLDPKELLTLGGPAQQNEPQEDVNRRKEERSTLLESASFGLSGDWKKWWPQQRQHQLKFDADGEDLVLKVSDNLNPWSIDFQERSRGFQWFFSFYLTFLVESKRAHQGAILLLDEPGLHLHITAQEKLLGFFQEVSKKNQLMYSSHSPFLVDPANLDNVRTVYLVAAEEGDRSHTKVSHGTEPMGDRATVLPLQAALGYELAQTLFLGKKTLIVEGITDYWLLKALSAELVKRGRTGLPDDVVILFAGGTSHMLPLVSMFARPDDDSRSLVVLLDADKAGLNKATTLKKELLPQDGAVALMSDGDLLGQPGVEVEDIITRDELLATVESLKGAEPKKAKAGAAKNNVQFLKAIYKESGWGEFTHQEKATVVMSLVDSWREGKEPSDETLSICEKVLVGLTRRLG
ncbi:MAG: AAA family ATPase [Bradymonadia bacterium]